MFREHPIRNAGNKGNSRARGAKAAGVALGRLTKVDAKVTIDAIVVATAALMSAIVVTDDTRDLEALARHFPGVAVLAA